MRTNKTHMDVVAKRSLSGHLQDPEKYIPLIERRVEYTSKLQQLGSLLVNQYICEETQQRRHRISGSTAHRQWRWIWPPQGNLQNGDAPVHRRQ